MTHYQKLVTIAFRTLGLLAIIASLFLWIMSAVLSATLPQLSQAPQLHQRTFILFNLLPHLIYLIAGIILYSSSRFLAIWICLDFDKQ